MQVKILSGTRHCLRGADGVTILFKFGRPIQRNDPRARRPTYKIRASLRVAGAAFFLCGPSPLGFNL